MILLAPYAPSAFQAKAAICGKVVQLGARSSFRFESYATAPTPPSIGDGVPSGALRIVRMGAVSSHLLNYLCNFFRHVFCINLSI